MSITKIQLPGSDTQYSLMASNGIYYGVCDTEAATIKKNVTLNNSNFELIIGTTIVVKFTNSVPESATLSINNEQEKNIYYRGQIIADGIIEAGDLVTFVYNDQYHLISIDKFSSESASIKETVLISEDNISSIDIPATIEPTNNLMIFLNGLLLVQDLHYNRTSTNISLIGFTVNNEDIITFIGKAINGIEIIIENYTNQASASATQASTYASNASASATQASTYASNASASAIQASTHASDAASYASNAAASASQAQSHATAKINVSLLSSNWIDNETGIYSQTVSISDGTSNSLISLQPTNDQLAQLADNDVLYIRVDNEDGTFIAKAMGGLPTSDMVIQGSRTEVQV